MSVISPTPLREAELRAVARDARDLFEDVWYDQLNHEVAGPRGRALRDLLCDGLIELEAQAHAPGYALARITDKGRRALADWEDPAPVVYSTRPRRTAMELLLAEPLRYDGGFLHASGEPVRPYLAKPLSDLLRAGLLTVPRVPGPVELTDLGRTHFDRWSAA